MKWGKIFATNRWLIVFTLYCGISVIWSDYPFVSIKRWIKELGNLIMVLIVITDKDPSRAFNAVFSRFTYLVIPLSVVFIKYYPEIGRYYNQWTWEYAYGGVTQGKNQLGLIMCVSGLYLISEIIKSISCIGRKNREDILYLAVLLSMLLWLLNLSSSITAIISLILGAMILLFLRHKEIRNRTSYIYYGGIIFCLIFLYMSYYATGVIELFVELVGRDLTFTGRTNLWVDLLAEQKNILVGSGYASFWLSSGAEVIWEKYYFHPTQAHNGYLQIYLDLGLVGLILLVGLMISTGKNLKE
ncbi:MAG: O-antigen ligase family protein, partial [Candidatus Hodarchaeales archaeon]